MKDDQRFLSGDQWPTEIRESRENAKRPIQTINRLPAFIDQVVGDARQNKPTIRVHPAEDGDNDIADIYNGLIRSIETESNADYAYDTAIEHTAGHGFGAWRIDSEYVSEDSFDQNIVIRRIVDPLNVLFDPAAIQPDYSDAEYVFVLESMPRKTFEAKWPKATLSAFESGDLARGWSSGDNVQVAEYWYKEHTPFTLYLLSDGSVSEDKDAAEAMGLVAQREAKKVKVCMHILSGAEILESKEDYDGVYLPIVGVQGKESLVDGKRTLRGITRFAKDPQRMYNYWRTLDTEAKALTPRSPVLVTLEQITGNEKDWVKALQGNLPYLPYNAVPDAPVPNRLNAGMADASFERGALLAVDEMKSTTGIHSASLGETSNETSGRAILARQREGDTSTFAYIDNLSRAIRYSGRVLLDLIPKRYNTARVIQVMGEDGSRKLMKINQQSRAPDGTPKIENDLTAGRYDLVVNVGPSYATKRIESAESMISFVQAVPAAAGLISDLIAKNMDWPGAEAIEKRLHAMLPPQVLQAEQEESGNGLPPGVQQMIDQGKQMIEQLQAELKKTQEELEDKDEDRRLKQYEIDVRAAIDAFKLELEHPDAAMLAEQVSGHILQAITQQAASAPSLEDMAPEEPPEMGEDAGISPMQGGINPEMGSGMPGMEDTQDGGGGTDPNALPTGLMPPSINQGVPIAQQEPTEPQLTPQEIQS
ncbi:MAG: hypothetical protein IPI20_21130 [Rhodoferax sp.]|nr:hypothetical protein [Rhodoferax sp.]